MLFLQRTSLAWEKIVFHVVKGTSLGIKFKGHGDVHAGLVGEHSLAERKCIHGHHFDVGHVQLPSDVRGDDSNG